MREDLLGYLLGALEPDEMQRVSEWLKNNPEGQQQLRDLERSLRPLEDGFEAIEGPSEDLLARTMASLPKGLPPQADEQSANGGSPVQPVSLSGIDVNRESSRSRNRWNLLDSVSGLISVATLLALLLPTIASDRFEARKTLCQEQLRELGTSLRQYVSYNDQGRLPQVAPEGPEAFAGIYAMRLADAGLLTNPSMRWCPSADFPDTAKQYTLPTVKELETLSVNELKNVQGLAGGHYAYTLGVVDERGYSPPRFQSRARFAVMADAPLFGDPSDLKSGVRFSHGDEGVNVLYEDGSVRFVRIGEFVSLQDHPFQNHSGEWEAGVNIDDASLAPSWRPPFSDALQR
ncbi:MAG: H-X9-DG-CTERM domain-containing protein [Planctomycetota bacterium]